MPYNFTYRRNRPEGSAGRLLATDYDGNLDKIEVTSLQEGKPVSDFRYKTITITDGQGMGTVSLDPKLAPRQIFIGQRNTTFLLSSFEDGSAIRLTLGGTFTYDFPDSVIWVDGPYTPSGVPPTGLGADESYLIDIERVEAQIYMYVLAKVLPAGSGVVVDTLLDDVDSEQDAALFLRSVTLGPTFAGIGSLLTLDSKTAWMDAQIAASFDGSTYAEYNTNGTPKQGWHEFVGQRMAPPRGQGWQLEAISGIQGHADSPQRFNSEAIALSALVYNNPQTGSFMDIADPNGVRAPQKELLNRIVWILQKFIPVSIPGGGIDFGFGYDRAAYFSLLARHAFGNYAEFLEDLSYHYPMTKMLTHFRNSAGTEDENYAREIVQLFSVGLYARNSSGQLILDSNGTPVETYIREDITQLARVFTGMTHPWRDHNHPDWYVATEAELVLPAGTRAGIWATDQRWLVNYWGAHFRGSTPGDVVFPEPGLALTYVQWGYRKPLSVVTAGKVYRVVNNTNAAADLAALGAPSNPSPGTIFTATANGTTGMNNGLVEERYLSFAGSYPRCKIARFRHSFAAVNCPTLGISFPAGVDPETKIRGVCRNLVRNVNTAPFVCLRLIRHAVTANPSPQYVQRVVNVFRANVDDPQQMAKVWKAIFLDAEALARGGALANVFSRRRDPFELWTNAFKSLNWSTKFSYADNNATLPAGRSEAAPYWSPSPGGLAPRTFTGGAVGSSAGYVWIADFNDENDSRTTIPRLASVWPSLSPSIFGYHPPEDTSNPAASEGLLDPEQSLYSGDRLSRLLDYLALRIGDGPSFAAATPQPQQGVAVVGRYGPINYDFLGTLTGLTSAQIVERLDLILTGGRSPSAAITALVAELNTLPTSTAAERISRLNLATQSIINGPSFVIQ